MQETNSFLDWAKIIVPVLGNMLIFIAGFFLLKKKLFTENIASLQKTKYEKVLDAHEKVWNLLAYLSEKHPEKSIFTVKGKEVQMNRDNAESYIKECTYIMYTNGTGLYISKEVINKIFTYRGFLEGIIKHSVPEEKIISIKREDTLKDARKHYEELNAEIKKSIAIDNNTKVLPK